MTRFTRILTAALLVALCTPVQARNWDRQAVPDLAYDIDGSDCENLDCYGAEAVIAAHAAGRLDTVVMRTADDCATLEIQSKEVPCHVGKPYLMRDDVRNIEPQPDGSLAISGPWYCNSLKCFGLAVIKLADDAGRLRHAVVLRDSAECHKLNFATMGGGTPCVAANR